MTIRSSNPIKLSAPGQYQGFSEKKYRDCIRKSVYVTASDGVKLALDYFIPAQGGIPVSEPLPVLFHFTPYGRVQYGRVAKFFNFGAADDIADDEIVFNDNAMEGLFDLWQYGYVLAVADCRGTGASFGVRITTNSVREAEDGRDIVEWLADQPFCNGKIGTFGLSYHGGTQLELMRFAPRGLSAAFVGCTDLDKYDGWFRGGIPRAFGSEPDIIYGNTQEEIDKTIEMLAADTVPVDEDNSRDMLRAAIKQHVSNGRQIPIMRDLIYRDSYLEASCGRHWQVIGNSYYLKELNDAAIPTYLAGGVFDVFRKETVSFWNNLTVPRKMLLGPWYHTAPKIDISWSTEALRWFDYWLKDIQNGIMDEAPICVKQAEFNFAKGTVYGSRTGSYFESEVWPPEGSKPGICYLTQSQSLSGDIQPEGTFSHTCRYGCVTSIESVYSTKPSGPLLMPVRPVPDAEKLVMDRIGSTFTGGPLKNDLAIAGHPMAYLSFILTDCGWMKDNVDLDMFVSLVDYDPMSGEGFLVTGGQLRTSLRKESDECHYDTAGLPWHRCCEGDNEWLKTGEKYDLKIDMLPTAYTFKKGHCLRISITNSLNNTYYYGRSQYEEDASIKEPVISICIGGASGSRVELPVMSQ